MNWDCKTTSHAKSRTVIPGQMEFMEFRSHHQLQLPTVSCQFTNDYEVILVSPALLRPLPPPHHIKRKKEKLANVSDDAVQRISGRRHIWHFCKTVASLPMPVPSTFWLPCIFHMNLLSIWNSLRISTWNSSSIEPRMYNKRNKLTKHQNVFEFRLLLWLKSL